MNREHGVGCPRLRDLDSPVCTCARATAGRVARAVLDHLPGDAARRARFTDVHVYKGGISVFVYAPDGFPYGDGESYTFSKDELESYI